MTEAIPRSQSVAARWALRLSAPRSVLEQYSIALIAIAVALAIRLALSEVLGGEASYLFFFPAILIASAFGGWGPGMVATAIGLSLALFLVTDARVLTDADVINAAVFTLVGAGASWRGELLRRSRPIMNTMPPKRGRSCSRVWPTGKRWRWFPMPVRR